MAGIVEQQTVDILLATYNGDGYLTEQLDSIFSQTHQAIRVIARDDKSSDATAEILQRYAEKYAGRFHVLRDDLERLGVVNNFFNLLGHARSDYVMFCDQDDVWLPTKIELTLTRMREIEAGVGKHIPVLVHTDLKVVDKDLAVLSESFWHYQNFDPSKDCLNRLIVQNVVTGCTAMMNRSLVSLTLAALPEKAIMHDWWLALVAVLFGKIAHIDTPTILYRQHANNDLGATRWSIGYVLKFWDKSVKDTIVRTQLQARELLETYGARLTAGQVEILSGYAGLDSSRALVRKYRLLRLGILQQGMIRNIALYFMV